MKDSTLTDRIRNLRIRTRARQPLKYRIELVRSRMEKSGSGEGRGVRGNMEPANQKP